MRDPAAMDGASSARVRRYPPGLTQAGHAHDEAHLSLMLAGEHEEETGRAPRRMSGGQLALRPQGFAHAVTFGADGALILTLPLHQGDALPGVAEPRWSPTLSRRRLRSLIPLLLEGGEASREAGCDLVALCAPAPVPAAPDPWLRQVRAQLVEAPAETRLIELARRAGRHRVHLGRAFLAAYGEPPSVFRRRAMLERALSHMAGGLAPAHAAAEAGFADQSHFSRACRDVWGLAPGRLLASAA